MEKARTLNVVIIAVLLIVALMTSVWADATADGDQPVVDSPNGEESRASKEKPTLGSIPASPVPEGVEVRPARTNAAVTLELDDGSVDEHVGVTEGSGGPSVQFIWLNRFTPAPSSLPFSLNQIRVFFDNNPNGATAGDAIDLVVYQDADGNPANGATLRATYNATVQVADGTNWSIYNLVPPVMITGSGDVLIGVIDRFVQSGVTPETYPAALDRSVSQSRSWVGWWAGDPPNPAVLPPNNTFDLVDNLGLSGNWLIRGYGETIDLSLWAYVPFVAVNTGGCGAGTLVPNDPSFGLQWGMSKIRGPRAWFCGYQGDSDVVVAVIDTGVDMDHPEFSGKLVAGRDFANSDNNPDDDHGHGTHVSGVVGATSNNNIGVAGVAWNTSIMPLKTIRGDGRGDASWSRDAVLWAADHGAHIINMSLGSVSDSPGFQDAINYAHNKGVLVIASAGNCGDQNYPANGCTRVNEPSYPGAYDNVVAVASTTSSDLRSSFSTQGSYVDVAAPGSFIYSTVLGGYGTMSGTSQAAPHVAGLAALVKAAYPGLTPAQIAAAIQDAAVDLGSSGWDSQFGWGRIDAPAALEEAASVIASTTSAQMEVEPLTRASGAEIVPGVVFVKFRSGTGAQTINSVLEAVDPGVQVIRIIPQIELLELSVPVGSEWDVIEWLRAQPQIEYAEPDTILRVQ